MKGAKMHDALARRRNADDLKMERMKTVDKYFDKWSNITSKFENWTAPEYYQTANFNFRSNAEKENKTMALENRRAKLRNLFAAEKEQFSQELNDLTKPKPRNVSSGTLKGINELFKRTEEEKRRLKLESGLYKRWRHSAREESILTNSKSDHEALAKMNWLDRQIADQMEREKLKSQQDSTRIQLMEEMRKDDERCSARKIERDEEAAKLKNFHEKQLNELRSRETETEQLHSKEIELRECEEKLQAEMSRVQTHANARNKRIPISNNIRRIKMQLRNLSDAVLTDIQFNIETLERLSLCQYTDSHQIYGLREKIDSQFELELQKRKEVEAMYESEASTFIAHQQDAWLNESADRETRIRDLIKHQICHINNELEFIVARKHELNEIRESLRKAIDNANDRIKCLLNANTNEEKFRIKSAEKVRQAITPLTADELDTNRDTNIELSLPDLVDRCFSIGGEPAETSVSTNGPRFGRKKIAWT